MGTKSRVRVAETFRSIFYAPRAVTIHGGHFAAEGLDVDVVTAEFGAGTVGMMQRGEADIALSGLMRSFDQADRGEAPLVHFAAVNDQRTSVHFAGFPSPTWTGAPMGFLGPVGIKIPLVVDQSVAAMPKVVVGGNALDVHLTGVVPGRDFPLDHVGDFRNAEPGDPCPRCSQPLTIAQGIERKRALQAREAAAKGK